MMINVQFSHLSPTLWVPIPIKISNVHVGKENIYGHHSVKYTLNRVEDVYQSKRTGTDTKPLWCPSTLIFADLLVYGI